MSPPGYPSAWDGRCCSAPRSLRPDAAHRPAPAAFPAECTRFSAICASAQSCRSTADSRGWSDVRHARDANELLEVASDELRTIVGDDSRLRFRVLLLGSLQDHFDISLSHGLSQIPMHEERTEPIQNGAQVIERAAQVDVGNVDMPVLMRLQRLLKPSSLARWLALPPG